MIGIINYGMGNLASVKNAFDYLDIKSVLVDDYKKLNQVDKILLPGVGAFSRAMENLDKAGLSNEIKEQVLVKEKPILGICLGMQLLLDSSTEHGINSGLGIVEGEVLFLGSKFNHLPVPHVGWNEVTYNMQSKLFGNIPPNPSFYFVHSYFCKLMNPAFASGITSYGVNFHSCIEKGNIFGCQFHPEKSQKNGLAIFKNFDSI